jgi:U4/U6.U5 tri-snRNP-associated protein 1
VSGWTSFPVRFHGKPPSKNKQEERQRKYLEELSIARATASDNPSSDLDRLRDLQKQTGSAFIPLTGRAKPGAAVRGPLAGGVGRTAWYICWNDVEQMRLGAA